MIGPWIVLRDQHFGFVHADESGRTGLLSRCPLVMRLRR